MQTQHSRSQYRHYANGDRALYSAMQVTTASDAICNPAAFLRATVQISTPTQRMRTLAGEVP
jgi:hypothetical protein